MTVAELIDRLKQFDGNLQVFVCDHEDGPVVVDGVVMGSVHPPVTIEESYASREARAAVAIQLTTGWYASDALFPKEARE